MSHPRAARPARFCVGVLCAGVLCAGLSLAGAGPRAYGAEDPARDPLTLAQQRLDAAKAEATDLSAKISAAQSEEARLQAAIADAQSKIPALRARATELRQQVKQRAAELYVHHGTTTKLESTIDADNAIDGLRAAHLTDTIGEHDLSAASELRATAAKLIAQEAQLQAQRTQLDQTLATLAPLNDLLQKKLVFASAAYAKVRALTTGDGPKQGTDVETGASVCPVQGVVVFTDDFGEPRSGGPHPGIDMGAVTGTPVVAVVDGFMRHDVGGDGGNGAWLMGIDHVNYYYAHFSRYEGDVRIVKAGDVIGYVGMTGNATGPHLHFEVHPGGGPPADPFATLLTLCTGDPPPVPPTRSTAPQ